MRQGDMNVTQYYLKFDAAVATAKHAGCEVPTELQLSFFRSGLRPALQRWMAEALYMQRLRVPDYEFESVTHQVR